ncbi:MAG: hypothetical protein IJ576_01485 [Synergistaceae bacterium]|nr:hypothetical protein [Synergistaceae bacterium]MBR1604177.1 hypothetical protein [Synergistaceae bacterium]
MPDTVSTYGRRPLVLCRIAGVDSWVKLPEISGKNDNALANITHFKLYFSFYKF